MERGLSAAAQRAQAPEDQAGQADMPIGYMPNLGKITLIQLDGVLTTDPSINKNAKKIDKISYEEMLEMSSLGAKVMQPNAVQAAMVDNILVNVKSTFSEEPGTKIVPENASTAFNNVFCSTFRSLASAMAKPILFFL